MLSKDDYYIVTDRWQKVTKEVVNVQTLENLSQYCDEFLVHAVDVEGNSSGIEKQMIECLGNYHGIPTTYAGGIHNWNDLVEIQHLGNGRVDYTIGSALDLFGGNISYSDIVTKM